MEERLYLLTVHLLHLFHAVQLFLTASRHSGLPTGNIFPDKLLGLFNLSLLRRILPDVIFPQQSLLFQEFGIDAIILRDRAVVDIADAVCDFIQKAVIVGHDQECMLQAG